MFKMQVRLIMLLPSLISAKLQLHGSGTAPGSHDPEPLCMHDLA